MYDEAATRGLLSCYNAMNLQPTLGVHLKRELAVTANKDIALLDALPDDSAGLAVDVLTTHPYSFAVAVEPGMFIIFDSHSHPSKGVFLAVTYCDPGMNYLHYFSEDFVSSNNCTAIFNPH